MQTMTAKSDAEGDLKSLPMAEVEKRLGSSADGLSQAIGLKHIEILINHAYVQKQG
jgi:hypothetical protein